MKNNRDLNYEEYLNQTKKEPSEKELNQMEKVLSISTILKNYKSPLNNLNYKPFLDGA